jgi:hypothetical protein
MSRETHVRFCESRGVRFPPATHLVVLVHGSQADTEALHEDVTRVLAPMGLALSPAKTQVVHMSAHATSPDGPRRRHPPTSGRRPRRRGLISDCPNDQSLARGLGFDQQRVPRELPEPEAVVQPARLGMVRARSASASSVR